MKKILAVLLSGIFLFGCAAPLSSMQRRTIESRDLEGKFDDAFKATLQVFQDYGYIVKGSDYQSGVIQGETGTKMGFMGIMTNLEITATLEQFGENTVKERLSLIKKVKTNSQYGVNENSQIVDNPELFQKIYDDIQKEMFVRQNLSR
ncbi:hypothetical protein ACFL1E_05905 [Candidatus Omnitrophota bacterium]